MGYRRFDAPTFAIRYFRTNTLEARLRHPVHVASPSRARLSPGRTSDTALYTPCTATRQTAKRTPHVRANPPSSTLPRASSRRLFHGTHRTGRSNDRGASHTSASHVRLNCYSDTVGILPRIEVVPPATAPLAAGTVHSGIAPNPSVASPEAHAMPRCSVELPRTSFRPRTEETPTWRALSPSGPSVSST